MKILVRSPSFGRSLLPSNNGFLQLSALLAAMVLSFTLQGIRPIQADEIASPDPEVSSLSGRQVGLGVDQLSATRERPLFASTRRLPLPPPAPIAAKVVAAQPPPPSPPPTVALLGTVLRPDKAQSFALVRAAQSDKPLHVSLGDEIETWKISEIEARQIVLSLDDRSVTIELASGNESGLRPLSMDTRPPHIYEPKGPPDARARRFNPAFSIPPQARP
jgi:hypothetical protein